MRRRAVIVRCGWGAAVGVCVLAILAIAGGQNYPPLAPATMPPQVSQAPRLPAYPSGLLPPGPEFYAGLGDSPAADSSRGQSIVTAEARVPLTSGHLEQVVPASGLAPLAPPPPSAPILPASPQAASMPIAPAALPPQADIAPQPVPPAPMVPATPVVTASAVIGAPTAPVVPIPTLAAMPNAPMPVSPAGFTPPIDRLPPPMVVPTAPGPTPAPAPTAPAQIPAPTAAAPTVPAAPTPAAPAHAPIHPSKPATFPLPVLSSSPSVLPTPSGLQPSKPEPSPSALAGLGSMMCNPAEGCDPCLPAHRRKRLFDSLHQDDCYGLKSLFDSLHPPGARGQHWYEKMSLRGYTQFRYGRTLEQGADGADPNLPVDRAINGNAENFSIRRARMIFSWDVSDHLLVYWQHDFANVLPGSSTTFFGQLRDLYGDVYIDKTKIHRFRVGLSKVPYGFENMQSSQNRAPLDRTDAFNSAVALNERDLGLFYYWTPVEKQQLFKDLVDGGLKGSGNFGIFGIGLYNGQGLGQLEQNLNPHVVARLTYPFQFRSGQVVETSVQGYTGEIVVPGSPIRPLGVGDSFTPDGTGGNHGIRDRRIAGSFIWYPQPIGVQAEWNVGEGPGLNDDQTAVELRSLQGGYVMAMYRHDGHRCGIFTPYGRWQYYRGGYKSLPNAPYGTHQGWDVGLEWQIRREMELTLEYGFVNGVNVNAIDRDGAISYRNFDGGVLRAQFQINY